jgi:hypothetical protein
MSPIIILGLVLMWGVVLVPMWLRRHDEAEESRSADRFSTAMHTLSRPRERTPDGRYVVMPHRTRGVDVHVSGAAAADPRPASDDADAVGSRSGRGRRLLALAGLPVRLLRPLLALRPRLATRRARPARGARRPLSAAARRRRTATGLLALTVVTLVLAVTVGGWGLWLVQVAADTCLAAFVRHLRRRAREAAIVTRQRRRATVAPARRVTGAEEQRPTVRQAGVTTEASRMPVWQRYAAAAQAAGEPAVAEPVAVVVDDGVVDDGVVDDAAPAEVALPDVDVSDKGVQTAGAPADEPVTRDVTAAGVEAGGEWAPVPVPPPTYTMKPAAPARRRRRSPLADPADPVELSAPAADHGAETAQTDVDTAADPAAATPKRKSKPATRSAPSRKRGAARQEFDDDLAELDAILEHRRAVND